MSPDAYRRVIKPRHARFFRQVHDACPQAKVALHSCGSIYQLIPDLIDTGVEALNPLQVAARDMDPARLKREFGKELTLWGGVDSQDVLPHGTPEDVRQEAARRIAEMAGGGGYILSAVHNIQPDVPTENVIALLEADRAFR